MLNIYFGRESINKEKFIFDNIKEKTLLLVPDQFTLEAEQRAFSVLGVKGLMDLEIISPSRLGFRVLAALGGNKVTHIDKYGRHMLLTKIITNEKDNLEAFKGMENTPSFIEMTNNLISEMKQYNTSPEQLGKVISGIEDDLLLHKKLSDIKRIYEKYEEYAHGKYVDTEDYINLFLSKLGKYDEIKKSTIWVWGFDYFTPKNLDLIRELMLHSKAVNIVLTFDNSSRDEEIFSITGSMINKLLIMAEEGKIEVRKEKIDEKYKVVVGSAPGEKAASICGLEKELFSIPKRVCFENEGITLIKAASIYAEAESAASYIVELIRDKGFRFRDIAVICNDMETRGSIIKRTFDEYGLPVFLDRKRNVMHSPIIEFIAALIDIPARGWLSQDVFRLAKTGFSELNDNQIEELENYTIKYRIRGKLWKNEFLKGETEYKASGLEKINAIREKLTAPVLLFEEKYKEAKSVEEKVLALYGYLKNEAKLPQKLEKLIEIQIEKNQQELADETSQIWGVVVGIFEQLIEIIGNEQIPNKEFAKILASGFEAIEIGIIPPTVDRIMVGTMQRTRASAIKALLVIGANDGVLPQESSNEGLLSEDEKARLYEDEKEICKIDEIRIREEKLAMYKTLSMPEKYLWMSHSITDVMGNEIKQSLIFDKLAGIFENTEIEKDIISRENPMDLISAKENSIKHMTIALRKGLEGAPVPEEWKSALGWYKKEEPETIKKLYDGIFYSGKLEALGKNISEKLYKKDSLKLSPSSIEKYGRCPFAFLMLYGLRPDERRVYEIAGREIGDIYHNCLMKMSKELSGDVKCITDSDSPWMMVTQEECGKMTDRLIEEETAVYREGLLSSGASEIYKTERIKNVCRQVAWILVEHVRQGEIKRVEFEAEFGEGDGKIFPAIKVEAGEQTVLIEGKIDRVDVLKNNGVKIIDYKSGKERFDISEVKAGYRLQLMLYLKAAQDFIDKDNVGGGAFYFQIDEPIIDASQMMKNEAIEKAEAEVLKSFKMDGIMLDDQDVIKSIAGEFNGFSKIVSIKSTKEGIKGTSDGKLLSNEAFSELRKAVDEKLIELCKELVDGNIQAKPKKTKTGAACDYCSYKSICRFDLAFEGCEYDIIN